MKYALNMTAHQKQQGMGLSGLVTEGFSSSVHYILNIFILPKIKIEKDLVSEKDVLNLEIILRYFRVDEEYSQMRKA